MYTRINNVLRKVKPATLTSQSNDVAAVWDRKISHGCLTWAKSISHWWKCENFLSHTAATLFDCDITFSMIYVTRWSTLLWIVFFKFQFNVAFWRINLVFLSLHIKCKPFLGMLFLPISFCIEFQMKILIILNFLKAPEFIYFTSGKMWEK
jgi:hypothetical protein